MKRNISISNFLSVFMFFSLFFSFPFYGIGQLPDKNLVEKYGLTIPPVTDKIEPAPEWLRDSDMITHNHSVWKNYKFTLKDTLMTRIVRVRAGNSPVQITEHYPVETVDGIDGSDIKGVPLISHVPHSQKAFEEAHKQGFRVIPYVHFMCIHSFYADQDVFLFQHPEILLKDKDGKWVHTPMDGSERLYRFLTCANSPAYWNLSLAYIKKLMDWGADGVFIDNVGLRKPCFGTDFNVPENSSRKNPEFENYTHEHLFPDASHDYAWDRMLQAIRLLVKSYGQDKIIIINSGIGTPFQKNGDCCMWESFIYSWAWEGRRHSWSDVKKRAQDNEWFLNAGRKITALSFLDPSRKEAKEDAFWAFSAAKLADFIWWASLNGTGAEILYQAHLGKTLGPLVEKNGIAFRIYENGVIVLNDNDTDQSVEITVPANLKIRNLKDLFNNQQLVQLRNKKLKVTIPKSASRVYVISLN